MKLNELLNDYVKNGWIRKEVNEDLTIYNYTSACQFDRHWDYYTKMSRGLILDNNGNIVARPFVKFFNAGETEETKIENLPSEVPIITEKLDGSLGILFIYKDKIVVTTRGSFVSDQAKWATEWVEKKEFKPTDFMVGYTYLFEILYRENRVVINYGDREELVLLTVIENETGKEHSYNEVKSIGKQLNLNVVKKLEIVDIQKAVDMLPTLSSNEEGFVVRYSNGLRIKLKGVEYFRLHRLLTGVSERSIWELLKEKQDVSKFLEKVPDEFYKWFDQTRIKLQDQYLEIERKAKEVFANTPKFENRKDYALYFLDKAKEMNIPVGILFSLLDNKSYEQEIWKIIKPTGGTVFKVVKIDTE